MTPYQQRVNQFFTDISKTGEGVPKWQWDDISHGSQRLVWPITCPTFQDARLEVIACHLKSIESPLWDAVHAILVFEGKCISRLDVGINETHFNPPCPPHKKHLELPRRIEGTHFHAWPLNQEIATASKEDQLPLAYPIGLEFYRVDEILSFFCQENNIAPDFIFVPEPLSMGMLS